MNPRSLIEHLKHLLVGLKIPDPPKSPLKRGTLNRILILVPPF